MTIPTFRTLEERLSYYLSARPAIPASAFVAPNATVIGSVRLGEDSSVWYQAVVRGDINHIVIGQRTNIQDGAILHVADAFPLLIGQEVSCGHRAILHASTVADRVLIGMGATVMDGAEIGSDSIIGAHSLVTKGTKLPPGTLIMGAPAKVVRDLTTEEIAGIARLAAKYVEVAAFYRKENDRQEEGKR
jgi:carbonic anhydrase/acetyltransferase-like protein (isoleucine patch superfamily)